MLPAAPVAVFAIAYLAIAFEHPLRINKSASALIGAGLMWTLYALGEPDAARVSEGLAHSLTETAQIVFFLIGAMTIVEVVDAHNGFDAITARIRTTTLPALLWLVALVTFFLSAVLDNLTTTIVMISLMRKLLASPADRLYFAGAVVIAANAGGAWSPIGDVTTTMLWIGGQITSLSIMQSVFLPSLVNLLVPVAVMGWQLRGQLVAPPPAAPVDAGLLTTPFERNLMLALGLGILVAVPVFKTVTHLPPFLGILFGLGLLWLVGDLVHRGKDDEASQPLTLAHALSRIDMASIVFFIGILLAVAVLQHTHLLAELAAYLDRSIGRVDLIVLAIGVVSAVVDNVPLVAAAMGMYSLHAYPADHLLWEFLAYCAGTGGSILIIGSAAGVAAMGMERISFGWYLRKFSGLALLGYAAGAAVYLLQRA